MANFHIGAEEKLKYNATQQKQRVVGKTVKMLCDYIPRTILGWPTVLQRSNTIFVTFSTLLYLYSFSHSCQSFFFP